MALFQYAHFIIVAFINYFKTHEKKAHRVEAMNILYHFFPWK